MYHLSYNRPTRYESKSTGIQEGSFGGFRQGWDLLEKVSSSYVGVQNGSEIESVQRLIYLPRFERESKYIPRIFCQNDLSTMKWSFGIILASRIEFKQICYHKIIVHQIYLCMMSVCTLLRINIFICCIKIDDWYLHLVLLFSFYKHTTSKDYEADNIVYTRHLCIYFGNMLFGIWAQYCRSKCQGDRIRYW